MKLQGAYTALVTPFKNGSLDELALRALVRRQIRAGIDGLVCCGSTGEAATLGLEEYRRVLRAGVEEAAGRVPVIAGVSSNDTRKAAGLCRTAEACGVNALLVLTPYYNKPTQAGLKAHFEATADASRLPIVVYNIPGRTAVNLLPRTLAALARSRPRIVAVKEASGSVEQAGEILRLMPDFTVLSGDDALTLPMMALGARGVVSVVSNLLPGPTARLCRLANAGDFAAARRLHQRMLPLMRALFLETNPIPVKAALGRWGLCSPELRLPLTPLSAGPRKELWEALRGWAGARAVRG